MISRWLAAAFLALACAPERELPLGATCSDGCAAGLVCAYGRCRASCDSDENCTCLDRRACALAGEGHCGASGCVAGLSCAEDDVCRVPCASSDDCALGYVCANGACFAKPPAFLPGWVFYTASEGGLRAVREDGSRRVTLGDGAEDVRLSPNGERLATVVSGELRVMASDGTKLGSFGVNGACDWFPESQSLLCYRAPECGAEALKVTALGGYWELLWTSTTRDTLPALNPTDPDDVVFLSSDCSGPSRVRRRLHGAVSDVTAIPSGHDQAVAWDRDGSRFLFSAGDSIKEVLASDTSVAPTLASGSSFGTPELGDHDGLFVVEDGELVLLGPEPGAKRHLGVSPVPSSRLAWGRPPFDIDRDDDGLANGLDPIPDGVAGCALSAREDTVGLWCLKEESGFTSAAETPGLPAIGYIDGWSKDGAFFNQARILDADVLDLTPPYSVRLRVTLDQLGPADAVLFSRGTWTGLPIDDDVWWLELRVRPNGSVLCRAGGAPNPIDRKSVV